jgi:hypothetical protein
MQHENAREKLRDFCKDLVLALVASVRSLSLYPPEHPDTKKSWMACTKGLISIFRNVPP